MANWDSSVRQKPFIMTLITNSSKVQQLSLEEGPMRYRNKNEDSTKNAMVRHKQCNYSNQLIRRIVFIISIVLVTSIGFIILFEVPRHANARDKVFGDTLLGSHARIVDNEENRHPVNSDDKSWKDEHGFVEKDDTSTNTLNDQTRIEITTEASEKFVTPVVSTVSSLSEINDTDIEELLSMWREIVRISETSINDDESAGDSDESSIFPDFSLMEPYYYNFSGFDGYQEFYDTLFIRFQLAWHNPDVWGSNDEFWDSTSFDDETIEPKKKRSVKNLFRRSKRRSVDETKILLERYRSLFGENEAMKNWADYRNPRYGELDVAIENWEKHWSETCERIEKLAAQIVIGNNSDLMIVRLRKKMVELVKLLAWHVAMVPSNDPSNVHFPVDMIIEDWRISMRKFKWEVMQLVTVDRRKDVQINYRLNHEITNELRGIVERFNRDYLGWVKIAIESILIKRCDIDVPSAMTTICRDSHFESLTTNEKSEIISDIKKESTKHSNRWYSASRPKPPTSRSRRTRRSSFRNFENSLDEANLITSNLHDPEEWRSKNRFTSTDLESSLELFFDRMETLSSHIDRLHERYTRLNELNDDYVSREFSVESALTDSDTV